MATIVTRAGKGSALSHNEVDANFTNLNSDKLEANSNITVADATVTGDLTVQGTTTTLNTATLQVEDKNITLNYATGDSSGSADGAGITIQDAVSSSTDATILWDATNDTFDFSHAIQVQGLVDIASGEIGLKNSGSVSNIKFYCEVSNAHYTALQSSPHSAYSGNVTLTLPPATDTLVGRDTTDTLTNKTLTSPVLTGNVGIGTASPNFSLEVQGSSNQVISIQTTGTTDNTQLRFGDADNSDQGKVNYDHSVDAMTLHTSDAERVRIDSSGNVGIGTTSPGGLLHLRKDTTDGIAQVLYQNDARQYNVGLNGLLSDSWIIYDNTAAATRFVLDTSGNVGIGTTSPSSKLEVAASSGDSITLKDTNLTASSSNIGNVRVAWDDSAGTRVAYVGSVNSDEFWVNNQYSKVVLTYAGSRMFETVSGGAKLYGKLNITDSDYDNHLELNRSSEQWRISPSTDGSLDVRRIGGTGTAAFDIQSDTNISGNVVATTTGSGNGTTVRYLNDHVTNGLYVGLRQNTTGDALIYHGDNRNIEFWTNAALRAKLTGAGNFELTGSQCQYTGGFGAITTGGTADWNHSTNARSGNGYTLMVGNATNGPGFASYYHPFSFEYNTKDGTGNMTQFAIPYNDPANQGMWFRSRYSGTWSAWSPVSIGVGTTASGIAASGDIYVGVNNESYLRFQGSTSTKYARFYLEGDEDVRFTEGGNAHFNGNVVAYSTTIASDAKLKDNVESLQGCLDKVCQMRGVSYTWNEQSQKEGVEDIGVIAQEMAEIYPEVVTEVDGLNGRDPHLTVDYARLTAVLINAVKELRAEVQELKNGAAI